jgi:hypothetical protein
MKTIFAIRGILFAGVLLAGVLPVHGQSISTDADNDSPLTSCERVHIRFSHGNAVRDEQDFTIPRSQAARLVAHPSENGGVRVQGWDRDEYGIKACKAAESSSDLGQISVAVNGGRVEVNGPSNQSRWVVYLIIQAPHDAGLEIATVNGEIGLSDLNGKIEARTTNGPIDLKRCGGEIHAKAENGPISFDGNSGSLRLETENGPLDVRLTGDHWEGAGIEGRTENGPLTLKVPRGYASGIHVEVAGNSPFSCEANVCEDAHGDWKSHHSRVDLGSGPTAVRISTVNGPVSIE